MNNFVPLLLYLLLLSVRSIFAKKTEKKSFSFAVLVLSQLLREGKQAATFYTRRALFSAALCLIFLFRNFQQYIIRNLQREAEAKKKGSFPLLPFLFTTKQLNSSPGTVEYAGNLIHVYWVEYLSK